MFDLPCFKGDKQLKRGKFPSQTFNTSEETRGKISRKDQRFRKIDRIGLEENEAGCCQNEVN